jgi:protein-S-isoprenylcysteine O-methyltransferase Ste14
MREGTMSSERKRGPGSACLGDLPQIDVEKFNKASARSGTLGWTGVALCLLGFGLAINARRHLGRNWGLPMSRKEQPELITSGPSLPHIGLQN